MGRSLSLAAYRALSRRHGAAPAGDLPPRPEGELVWCHATDSVRFSALCDIARRLAGLRPGLHALITYDGSILEAENCIFSGDDILVIGLSSDHPNDARRFLLQWSPDVCLWAGAPILVNHVSAASERKTPMILTDLGSIDLQKGRHSWIPDLTRRSLEFFDTIQTNSEAAARVLRRMGVSAHKISVAARLRMGATPPPCSDEELASVMGDLNGRPVWLAARVRRDEIDQVLTAHRIALRLSHRLLLVIVLDDPADREGLAEQIAECQLRWLNRDGGDRIDDNIQVVLGGGEDDLGLWYRVAPLTFLAGSLVPGIGGTSPLEAAALGSALVSGPHHERFADTYARLEAAGAAVQVNDGASLGIAVAELVAPDRAATMALAGWEVATEGADLADRLVDMVQDALDQRRAAHARS
ncbi:3-deoxy-D-manno-octulosonic acid transferase [Albibacillus kandeliae]|uniref:3-deoxy-D-manno-octulosonic acid transferase n=1 Tax=Albibacillus kandeliae TaxID=2174228 RepID=UPI000D693C37|nr:glycosyltransferase N-terminal domain-containing protein [Albibacillus kandeliae]